LDKPVRKGRLAMIDVCDNTKITDKLCLCHYTNITGKRRLFNILF
jgi:hypothetical protein